MVATSRILGIKLIIISLTLLTVLIADAKVFASLLQLNHSIETLSLQLWGVCVVFGGLLAGTSLIQLKKIHYIHSLIYLLMAIIFIFLPLIIAKSPYVILELLN